MSYPSIFRLDWRLVCIYPFVTVLFVQVELFVWYSGFLSSSYFIDRKARSKLLPPPPPKTLLQSLVSPKVFTTYNTRWDQANSIVQMGAQENVSFIHPAHKYYRFLFLLFLCFMTFGSYWCYDIPDAIQSKLKAVCIRIICIALQIN